MDIGTGLKTSPTLTLAICCYLRSTHPHTPTPTQGEGICKSKLYEEENQKLYWTGCHLFGNTLPSGTGSFHLYTSLSYLPVLVRTMKALAQHLKEASTAPTATASEGSLVSWECLLSSSNSCLWKVAASASRAIWTQRDHEGRVGGVGGYSQSHTTTAARIHSHNWEWQANV